MRFTRLIVDSFQAIQRAEVEFGPNLNILYGPNDLGKSTLASAMRAALLCPPGSAEGGSFAPWYADAAPRVTLAFAHGSGHHWKVVKGFGHSGSTTAAELHHSKDGTSFSLDCKAREVEEKLRALLAWGIPAPGGKGGPRSMPTSFLSNVLLGAQTDVDSILGRSLEKDLDDTGKIRLSKALATLAQDPTFKKVFDAAQIEFDRCFTGTGKRKRGQASKFTEATRQVKDLDLDLAALRRQQTDSEAIEQSVNALRERRSVAHQQLAEAKNELATTRTRLTQTEARSMAVARLGAATSALAAIDLHARKVAELASEIEKLQATAKTCAENVAKASVHTVSSEDALKLAEDAHRVATSDDGQKDREVRRAQLAEQVAANSVKKQMAQVRRTEILAALAGRTEARNARSSALAAATALTRAHAEIVSVRDSSAAADAEVDLARSLVAYGRWRAAVTDAEEHKTAFAAAADARAMGDAKEASAATLDGEVAVLTKTLDRHRERLPTSEQAKQLATLEHDLDLSEAALGGGLSVVVKPRSTVTLRIAADQESPVEAVDLTTERVFDADRTLRLSIGELVDIEVTAGAAEKRRAVENLRSQWTSEGVPVLARAEVASLAEVLSGLADLATESGQIAELRARAAQLRKDASADRGRAILHDGQSKKPTETEAELEARKVAIGAADHAQLQRQLDKLGTSWEVRADTLQRQKEEAAANARARLVTLEQAAKVLEYQSGAAEETAGKLEASSKSAVDALGQDPDALLGTTDEALKAFSTSERQLEDAIAKLAAEATGKAQDAKRAVDAAQLAVENAKKAHGIAAARADVANARLHAGIGEAGALRSQLEAMDRPAASLLHQTRTKELAELPDVPATSVENVAEAERRETTAKQLLEAETAALHTAEGALSQVGGSAVREEVERLQEALAVATANEKDLEVDADAWKLLLETMREVENEEGAHLGRALGGPVSTRFGELTEGRYKNLKLDALLKTESLDIATGASGGSEVLEALSTGTRDQLATLIRLTIADQLKTAIILDDHLVHTDPKRLAWFRDVLTKTALNAQVIVLTCRPEDYLSKTELPDATPTRDLAGGAVRAIDMARVVKRWEGIPSARPPATTPGIDAKPAY